MKRIFFLVLAIHALLLSCGEPKGPGKAAGNEVNSAGNRNENDYDTNKDTIIDMNSGGGVGPGIYKADSLSNKRTKSGKGH